MEFRRGLATWRDFEDVFVEPVARSTAVAAATTMSPTTAVNRRQLIWIPLLSELPGLSRELYLSSPPANVKGGCAMHAGGSSDSVCAT
jgi:hypothetical protein